MRFLGLISAVVVFVLTVVAAVAWGGIGWIIAPRTLSQTSSVPLS
jgi:hypothetical protein